MSKLEGLDTRGINSNEEEPTTFDIYLKKRQYIKHKLGSEGFDNVIRGFELADKCHDMFELVDTLYEEVQKELYREIIESGEVDDISILKNKAYEETISELKSDNNE